MSEALQTKLDAHIQESDRHYLEMTAKLKEIGDNLSNKVSWKEFTWILALLITILMGMFGWIAWQIADLQKTAESTNKNISLVQGKLEPYNIEFKN